MDPDGAAVALGGGYRWLCFQCHQMVMLSPADAVVAEGRAIVGDLTIVFCHRCREVLP
jgi:hypothetical protein